MAYMYTKGGLGCACNDKPQGVGDVDWEVGGDSLPDVSAFALPTLAMPDLSGIPTWGWIAGGALALWFLTGATGKRRARRRIYADYKKRLDEADTKYSTRSRLRRAKTAAGGLF